MKEKTLGNHPRPGVVIGCGIVLFIEMGIRRGTFFISITSEESGSSGK